MLLINPSRVHLVFEALSKDAYALRSTFAPELETSQAEKSAEYNELKAHPVLYSVCNNSSQTYVDRIDEMLTHENQRRALRRTQRVAR
jgi:hypothetical protein